MPSLPIIGEDIESEPVLYAHFFLRALSGGGPNGVLHRGYAPDRAGPQRVSVHDRGVEFVFALGSEDCAFAGVEHSRVFNDDDRRFAGANRVATDIEDRVSGVERLLECYMVQSFALGGKCVGLRLLGPAWMTMAPGLA